MQDAEVVLDVLRERACRERGVVAGEPGALKGARRVRREAARERPVFARDLAGQPTLRTRFRL